MLGDGLTTLGLGDEPDDWRKMRTDLEVLLGSLPRFVSNFFFSKRGVPSPREGLLHIDDSEFTVLFLFTFLFLSHRIFHRIGERSPRCFEDDHE